MTTFGAYKMTNIPTFFHIAMPEVAAILITANLRARKCYFFLAGLFVIEFSLSFHFFGSTPEAIHIKMVNIIYLGQDGMT